MRISLFLLFSLFICLNVNAQFGKRNRNNGFQYTYEIGDEMSEREYYKLLDSCILFIGLTENDSLYIQFNCIDYEYYIDVTITGTTYQNTFLLTNRERKILLPKYLITDSIVIITSLDGGPDNYFEYVLNEEDVTTTIADIRYFEKSTILNDPDSGGIIIHSKRELLNSEIETIVWCYIKKEENCYNTEECQISIVL